MTGKATAIYKNYTYLALGDSYTIGEGVVLQENFPYQVVKNLRKSGYQFNDPDIIATTGWTTDELAEGIRRQNLKGSYDIVSLLIGVNDQYRGKSVEDFIKGFEPLLSTAIQFAAGKNDHVFVLSIPDWGVTPFAEGRDRKKVAEEIDAFNRACQVECNKKDVLFIDITSEYRINGMKPEYLVPDHLHPSAKEYSQWCLHLCQAIQQVIN